MKKYLIAIVLLAAIFAAMYIGRLKYGSEPTLAELQTQYLLAQTATEKAAIVDALEKYYLNFSVPDRIRERVGKDVAKQLDTTKIDLAAGTSEANVYRLESQLQQLLEKAAIARAREQTSIFQTIVAQAQNMAHAVDMGAKNRYWTPFVDEVRNFTKEKAVTWLKTKRAEGLAYLYQDSTAKVLEAERYASLGLKLLQEVNDERLRLDIIQRLQWILFRHHCRFELAAALAQKALTQADRIKYYFRANGFIYGEAETRSQMGQSQAALALYQTLYDNAEKLKSVNGRMAWFTTKSLIGKAGAYVDLGEFEKALNICEEVEKLFPSSYDTVLVRILQFNSFLGTAHYDPAEKALNEALAIAKRLKDDDNRIICLGNLGAFHYRLTEYDAALDYLNQAKALFTDFRPSFSKRVIIFTDNANTLIAKNDSVQFKKVIAEAESHLRLAYSPYKEAYLLYRIGDWYQTAKKCRAAIEYYQKADSISEQNGFLQLVSQTRIERVKCLIALSRFHEAKTLLTEIEPLAQGINDFEQLVEVYHQTARLKYLEGNVAQALESSKALLQKIEEITRRFNNPDRLMAYRQKVYDFLKQAVFYEIALHHRETAFAKLDEVKSCVLETQLFLNGQADSQNRAANNHHIELASGTAKFPAKSLLLSYMVMPDTLYVFMLDDGGLQLLRKKLDIKTLRQTCQAYRDSINTTLRRVRHDQPQQTQTQHFNDLAALGQTLYQDLLGWPEITSRLQEIEQLYIVPDEFLHEIPFATLMAKPSDPQTLLVNCAAVSFLPSASLLNNAPLINGAYKLPRPEKVLISADKRFPGAENLVVKIKKLFPTAEELTLPDGAATKTAVLAKLQNDYQLYIFLGHGQANRQYPDRGYIELSVQSPPAPGATILRLSVADLKTINWLGAEMVMLIGCETAGGKLYRGTGISGLQQEFLSLGVKNVVGNLWAVDATHAIPQAQDFLMAWAESRNLARALQASQRQAVQTLLRHRYYQQPFPYFWGSPVLLTTTTQ